MSSFRQNSRLQALWILGISALLLLNPLSPFGWVELIAVVGPLMMAVERRIWREAAFAIGLPAITLLWLADPAAGSVLRLLVGWAVFGVGVLLAARSIDSQQQLETVAGQVAFDEPDPADLERFEVALERELARARRHEHPFALLSVAAHPRSLESDPSGKLRGELLRSLAVGRARLELRDFLQDELHVYCEVEATDAGVLALVPEIHGEELEMLVKRLQAAAGERLDFELQVGVARFPDDAVAADELIAVADASRTSAKLQSLPETDVVKATLTGLAPDGKS